MPWRYCEESTRYGWDVRDNIVDRGSHVLVLTIFSTGVFAVRYRVAGNLLAIHNRCRVLKLTVVVPSSNRTFMPNWHAPTIRASNRSRSERHDL